MWKASFVATSVALGVPVDEALSAIGPDGPAERALGNRDLGALVDRLRAPQRATRAAALAAAVHTVVAAVEEATLV
jgi:hypothetical protein